MNIIKTYYASQALKGYSLLKATAVLPEKILNQVRLRTRKNRHRNVVDGFSRFDLPLLASYPRSGTNWTRYFLEVCSNRPTPGQTRYIEGNDFVIDRAHRAYPILHRHRKVVLVLRDYKECFLRQHKEEWLALKDVKKFLEAQYFNQPCDWYIKNIKAFDRFQGEKLLLYHEDIVGSAETEFRRLGEFLALPEESVSGFMENLESHFNASVAAYTSGGHSSETSKSKDFKAHSRKLLTEDQEREIDNYYSKKFPDLAEKYLKRYLTLEVT